MEDPLFRKLSHFACVGDIKAFKNNFDNENLTIHYGNGAAKDTLPHIAARNGHLSILKYLKENCGIKYLEGENADGKNCLHEAAQHGHYECVSYLLNIGFNVDALKRADWTPLMLACTKTNLDVIKILVNSGANLNLINKDGWTCLHIACREGNENIVAFLLSKNSEIVNVKSKNGRTPLHSAVLHGRCAVTELLLKTGNFTCNETDSCGTTPIMDALRSGNIECAELLLKYNCLIDLHRCDANGREAIHLAAEAEQIESIKFLIERNVIIDKRTRNGNTPLHIACREGHFETVKYLINKGADIFIRDNKNRNAIDFASSAKNKEVAMLLNDIASSLKIVIDITTSMEEIANKLNAVLRL